jgi:hypothetical protein
MRKLARVLLVLVFCALSASAAQAFISFTTTKTVGLAPPPACAGSSSITVPSGTTVWYCYTITTAGNVTLNYALVDDQLGTITSSGHMVGGTDQQFASTVANSRVTNIAKWETSIANGSVFGTANATVDIFNPVPALAPPALLMLGGALLFAGLFLLRRIG